MQRLHIWDLPTRLFHWLLALSITGAIITGKIGGNLMEWHARLGLFIVGLVTFRVVWGLVGSSNSRFASFVRGPRTIAAYLRGEWKGIGHNPLGALSVIGLLALTGAQVATGLFANDDIAFQGPLADLVGTAMSNKLRGVHGLLQYGLIGLVLLHFAAIVFYVRVKRDNLLKPMVTGWKDVHPAALPENAVVTELHPGARGGVFAFVFASIIASSAVYVAAGGLLPHAPPPQPASTPGW